MDDESAEIELATILNSFDTRLLKLEKSILPLYTSTQRLNKRASNIDKALLKIDELASNHEGAAAEESTIIRGPQAGNLEAYKDAMERLNAAFAFQSGSADTARLIETGAKKLAQLYTTLVAESSTSSGVASSFPSPLLVDLVGFLRTLPLPSTHPSHAAAPGIATALKDAARGYADMRGNWARKALEAKTPLFQDSVDPIPAGTEFGQWVEELVIVAEQEQRLLDELNPMPSTQPFSVLLNPLLTLLSNTFENLVGFVKRTLHSHAFMALSAYEYMIALQTRCDSVFAGRSEFKDGLNSLRTVALRSFPEFLADIKLSRDPGGSSLTDFVITTVKYMNRLPEVRSAAGLALVTLGDGNWKMGDGKQVGMPKKDDTSATTSEAVLLDHYIYDVLVTTLTTLNNLSRFPKRAQNPALTSVFVLNNVAYVRSQLLDHELVGKPVQDLILSNWRMAKATYFDGNWGVLVKSLGESGGGKTAVKERAARFYDLLDEVVERHRGLGVLEDDADAREEVADDSVKLVVPNLERFISKHRDREFSRNPQKHIRLSPEDVDAKIRNIYR
ncbi:hypothetical protein CYLTODRAFT_454368 [Cylindrobasidium torrendii FP15055 ss-10]|uniref:Exocyst complex protein EXO70 n=1 Tax=Cylindrobasidium torrendii FP15055 ss-10 TaxID=1314674 RepID=A0A0D7BAH6_9AGAR|nr:hypothetical protein CYLTODRAFT_454368 [Cylindrobasidium torrendii FP15055 ss-10]